MDPKPEAIMQHIERQREELGQNLDMLERRVKTATDWRTWARKWPLAILGVLFAAGFLMAVRRR